MNKKILAALFLSLSLMGCTTTEPVYYTNKYIVVEVDQSLFSGCEASYARLKKVPNPDTLTDRQISNYILSLEVAAKKCHDANGIIKKFLEQAKHRYETQGENGLKDFLKGR